MTKLAEKQLRWQDVTIDALIECGIDVDGNMPEEELAPYKNAYAWGRIPGNGLSIYCKEEDNAEIATAFIEFRFADDIVRYLVSRGWRVTKDDNYLARLRKGNSIAELEIAMDGCISYMTTSVAHKTKGDRCDKHYDKVTSNVVAAAEDKDKLDEIIRKTVTNYTIVAIINQWEIDHGCEECEQIANVLEVEDFCTIAKTYGQDAAVRAYERQRECGAPFYLIGSNYEEPTPVNPVEMYDGIAFEVLTAIRNRPENYAKFFNTENLLANL